MSECLLQCRGTFNMDMLNSDNEDFIVIYADTLLGGFENEVEAEDDWLLRISNNSLAEGGLPDRNLDQTSTPAQH